jgi:hypothetical protein
MSRMMAACDGTDQRLDEIIEQNNRMIEQIGQLIDIGIEAVAAIKAAAPEMITINAVAGDAFSMGQAIARQLGDIVPGLVPSPDVAIGAGVDTGVYEVTRHDTGEPVQVKEPARKRKRT